MEVLLRLCSEPQGRLFDPPRLYCAGLFRDLDTHDPNLALRECEGIDGKGPYSIKKAKEKTWLHFPDDDLLDRNGGGAFITFI